MCGIFGCSLKPRANKQAALNKFKVLGMYNISRGRDASGVFIDGKIEKSTDEFDDFIEKRILPSNFKGSCLLGHTRQGSLGYGKTEGEAHPFLINENLIFTHNGTIKNIEDLCRQYSVSKDDFNVDSKLLGLLLYTEGHNVLTKYKGAAALAYTYLDDPDTLYLYHGESKDYKMGTPLEERPLYFMKTKEGVFYSSLENSLNAIKDNESDKPLNLKYNTIIKIKDGEFLYDDTIAIDRIEANVNHYDYSKTSYNDWEGNSMGSFYPRRTTSISPNRSSSSTMIPVKIGNAENNPQLILRETLPKKLLESLSTNYKIFGQDFIYYHFGRYWTTPRTLVDGPIYLKKGGIINKTKSDDSELCFFFRGVLLNDEKAYKELMDLKSRIGFKNWVLNPKDYNFAAEICKYSHHPVTNLPEEYSNEVDIKYRYKWYNKKNKQNDSFTPRFHGRNYTIKDGFLISIGSSHRETCIAGSELYMKNQLIEILTPRVQGGNSNLLLPFQSNNDNEKRERILSNTTDIRDKDKEEKFSWFFEKIYGSLIAIHNDWDEEQFEALRRFIVFSYKRDFSMDALPFEVNDMMDSLLDATIKSKISVGEFLNNGNKIVSGTPGDSDILLKYYEEVINEGVMLKDKKTIVTSSITEEKAEDLEEELEEDEEDVEFERDEKVIECLVDLENIQATAFDLVNDQKSDYAQEIAGTLISGVNNILCNLSGPLNKFGKDEIQERVNKIRETKNLENGIL